MYTWNDKNLKVATDSLKEAYKQGNINCYGDGYPLYEVLFLEDAITLVFKGVTDGIDNDMYYGEQDLYILSTLFPDYENPVVDESTIDNYKEGMAVEDDLDMDKWDYERYKKSKALSSIKASEL